jgi:hypothetical protein
MMSVTFEWLTPAAAILRLHDRPGAAYGDPYVWWTVGVLHADGAVELKGADRPLPPGGLRALCTALRAAGFTRRVHDRISADGTVRRLTKEL